MSNSSKEMYWDLRRGAILLTLGFLAVVTILSALRYAGHAFFEANSPRRFRDHVANPIGEFEKVTGLSCPASTQPVLSEDTHGGFHGDGKLYIALRAKQEVVEGWLADRPPWDAQQWRRGPVPIEIGIHCSLPGRRIWSISGKYEGDQQSRELLESEHVWYAAKDRGPSSIRWHNGSLLLIDTKSDTAWLFVWDM